MSINAGPIESATISGRYFSVAQDSDPGRVLGGNQNAVELNGDGTSRNIQEVVPWKYSGIGLQIDDARGDQEFIQDIIDNALNVDFSFTHADGTVYYGQGTITEETSRAAKTGIMEITAAGGGKLTKQ